MKEIVFLFVLHFYLAPIQPNNANNVLDNVLLVLPTQPAKLVQLVSLEIITFAFVITLQYFRLAKVFFNSIETLLEIVEIALLISTET
jgi:hypothetical protein